MFLLDRVQRHKDDAGARKCSSARSTGWQLGGIHDHLGGGFHRYSVDRYWQIPHFEKMLYDNGQLASVYAEALRADRPRATSAAPRSELCDFVLREMTDASGGFYAALDADSEGEEGKFYRWDKSGGREGPDARRVHAVRQVYGLDGDPNFEEKFYAPQLAQPLAEMADGTEADARRSWKRSSRRSARSCFDVRAKRPRPLTDTKILTADNGLMIGGLADAGRILKEPRYIEAADEGGRVRPDEAPQPTTAGCCGPMPAGRPSSTPT